MTKNSNIKMSVIVLPIQFRFSAHNSLPIESIENIVLIKKRLIW